MIVVIIVDAVNGGVVLEEYRSETRCHGHEVGLEDCIETRCGPEEPAIRFPFRLKGRQPIHCGCRGFDVSCTDDMKTILELPSSSAKLRVVGINYTSHAIGGSAYDGCLPRELFNSNDSYPFEFVGNATLFSCPPSTVRDKYCSSEYSSGRLVRLSPCRGNHIYAVADDNCSIDEMPLVSCIKVVILEGQI
ncbi:hypothetical protein ACE6H2_020117 [Prunus campanulata]